MKIPKPPPTYNKDRTLTRRTVKGAAGGMKGVDYEDDRRADPTTLKGTTGAGSNRDTPGAAHGHHKDVDGAFAAQATEGEIHEKPGKIREEDEMVLDDEDSVTRDKKKKERKNFVPRDRLTIDKDAPQLIRKRKWEQEEDEPEEEQEEEIDVEELVEAILSGPPEDTPTGAKRKVGDPTLTSPADIHRKLGAPIAYAKHVMLLAETFRAATGATREEAVAYLGAMFCALPDRTFGRLALKELGPATGIIDIYPLEVVEHILEHYPAFLPKVGFGTLFSDRVTTEDEPLQLIARVPERLTYPEGTRIRGFAIRGGARPGYRFEPADEDDVYTLRIDAGGRFEVLVSGLLASGRTLVDRLHVEVIGANPPPPLDEPARDDERVIAWNVPTVPPFEPEPEATPAPEEDDGDLMSAGEIVQRQQLDALRGPKGDDGGALDFSSLEELGEVEEIDGPPTDEHAVDLLDAPTYDSPPPAHESIAQSAMRRLRTQIGADPEEDRLSEEDEALLDLAVQTFAEPPDIASTGFPDETMEDLDALPPEDED